MGIITREKLLYLKVSCGVMKNKQLEKPANGYHGTFAGIREKKGTFEGQPTCDIEVKMKSINEEGTVDVVIIQFRKEGWYSLGFFARIKNVDIKSPFTIGVMPASKNEKMSFCYLKQEGIDKVKADKTFPKYELIKVGDKDIQDWSKPLAAMDEIMKYLNESIKPTPVAKAEEGTPTVEEGTPTVEEGTQGDSTDDLPF